MISTFSRRIPSILWTPPIYGKILTPPLFFFWEMRNSNYVENHQTIENLKEPLSSLPVSRCKKKKKRNVKGKNQVINYCNWIFKTWIAYKYSKIQKPFRAQKYCTKTCQKHAHFSLSFLLIPALFLLIKVLAFSSFYNKPQ